MDLQRYDIIKAKINYEGNSVQTNERPYFFTIFLVEEFMLLISEIRTVSAEATRESVRMEK